VSERLLGEVRDLLRQAEVLFAQTPAAEEVSGALRRLDGPLQVAFSGKVKAGKSTLLNALVGEQLAPTDAGECTKVVSWYENGLGYRVDIHPKVGDPRPARFRRTDGALEIDLDGEDLDSIERLVVQWPASSLHELTLIDTPGIESISVEVSARAMNFLAPGDERATEADAVIYLMRHLHASDRRFLEAFHDQELSQATPVNTVAILSRADEIGVARLDAMESARNIAARYRADPQIRRLCQTVVAVGGLIAEAAATLREDEFRAFQTLAAAPRDELDALLVSVDRFSLTEDAFGLLPIEREHLLSRFGLFGVRLCVDLINRGTVTTAGQLAAELSRESGIDELRQLLDTVFRARRSVLKARAGLIALRSVAARYPTEAEQLERELERIMANAHEISELRLLNGIRSGQVVFKPEMAEQLEQIVGSTGTDSRRRLGLPADATDDEVRGAAVLTLGEWRNTLEHPMTSREQSEALQIAVGSVERLLADLA
jgi:GTPase SAR1 family protein